jgi:valyl-tRNA synthetase
MSLDDRYNPKDVETKIYQWWESSGYFKCLEQSTKPPFCILLPPPNVTGFLHLGHALDHTIQDVIIRYKRMNGFNTLWLPGTDHAGIATQVVVEKEVKKQGSSRLQMGREKFVEKVWDWKNQYGDRIYSQMRKLGDSCDWQRAMFTLDESASKAVRKVFVSLHKKNLIYRGLRLVNWSGPLESAISDLEVEHREVKGSLWHIRYPVESTNQFLTVATTRPETMLGDTAVCVHPEDPRYKNLIGKKVILPLLNRAIPIIADPYVDQQFGSGVVKITPAHDFNDYKIGKAHNLSFINILNKKCELNENAGPYKGLKVAEARKKVLEDLTQLNLIEKEEPHKLSVGHCSRTGAVVEPYLSEQWFVKMEPLAKPAKHAVENGTIRFEPESWTKTYLHWMNIIEDWCISRQLWWGHRIPAWYCKDCSHITVSENDPSQCESCGKKNLTQDEDVLDTWFSSALWPFSTLGWPKDNELLKTFYPTNTLVTGHDIIFFWVARMIMMGIEFKKDVPFRNVYIHGLVRDSQGQKMSKSLGNSVDPIDMIEKHGADALRFSIISQLHSGRDLKFSEQRVEAARNFMNKIWNASRFCLNYLKDFQAPQESVHSTLSKGQTSTYDQWIVFRLKELEAHLESSFEQQRFSDAANQLYSFIWNEFCDWYIEFIKPIVNDQQHPERNSALLNMSQILNRVMRLLHPFTPFLTEEIYQMLPIKSQACIIDEYPNPRNDQKYLTSGSEQAADQIEIVKAVITAARNIRGENKIKAGAQITCLIQPNNEFVQKVLGEHKQVIMNLARIDHLEIGEVKNLAKSAVSSVTVKNHQATVVIPLEGIVDLNEEIKRIQKNIEKLDRDINSLSSRLNNENFTKNAAEEVVEADKLLLSQSRIKVQSLKESLARLQS